MHMAVDRKAVVTGSIFILLGLLFLGINLTRYGWEEFWPLAFIGVALGFFGGFLADRSNYGLLMPAVILATYGAMFQYCALTDWENMSELWPGFILGPGMGLLTMYLLGPKEAGLLIPAYILIGTSAVFFIAFGPFRQFNRYWPVLLILAGIALLLKRRNVQSQSGGQAAPHS